MRANFTLNLGLRWEYITPIYEVADRQVNINTFTGQLLYANADTEFGRALYKPYKKQFMPNLGFAWTPFSKLVVRAGYRFSTFLEGTGANLRLTLNPPFFAETDVVYDARTAGDIRTGFSDLADKSLRWIVRERAPHQSFKGVPGTSTSGRSLQTSSTSPSNLRSPHRLP